MNKFKYIPMLSCFGLAAIFYLLDLSKITFSAGRVAINIYPAIALILLGLILIWRELQKSGTQAGQVRRDLSFACEDRTGMKASAPGREQVSRKSRPIKATFLLLGYREAP